MENPIWIGKTNPGYPGWEEFRDKYMAQISAPPRRHKVFGDRSWTVGSADVYEISDPTKGVQLLCDAHDEERWCQHRQHVVLEGLDAPLLGPGEQSVWVSLEVQPTTGFYVSVHLDRTTPDADTFTATAYDRIDRDIDNWYSRPLGEFFPSDARLSLRTLFLAMLTDEPDIYCKSITHNVMRSREPSSLYEKWQLLCNNYNCMTCAVFTDTSQDVPEL